MAACSAMAAGAALMTGCAAVGVDGTPTETAGIAAPTAGSSGVREVEAEEAHADGGTQTEQVMADEPDDATGTLVVGGAEGSAALTPADADDVSADADDAVDAGLDADEEFEPEMTLARHEDLAIRYLETVYYDGEAQYGDYKDVADGVGIETPIVLADDGETHYDADEVLRVKDEATLAQYQRQQAYDMEASTEDGLLDAAIRTATDYILTDNQAGLLGTMRRAGLGDLADYYENNLGSLDEQQMEIALADWVRAASIGSENDTLDYAAWRASKTDGLTDEEIADYTAYLTDIMTTVGQELQPAAVPSWVTGTMDPTKVSETKSLDTMNGGLSVVADGQLTQWTPTEPDPEPEQDEGQEPEPEQEDGETEPEEEAPANPDGLPETHLYTVTIVGGADVGVSKSFDTGKGYSNPQVAYTISTETVYSYPGMAPSQIERLQADSYDTGAAFGK